MRGVVVEDSSKRDVPATPFDFSRFTRHPTVSQWPMLNTWAATLCQAHSLQVLQRITALVEVYIKGTEPCPDMCDYCDM